MPNLNILVVEDEVIVAEEISECLVGLGYKIVALARSGAEALKRIGETQVDLALLDINIQGNMDGIELAEAIRKEHNCPIVFLSAYSDDATLNRAKRVRPEAYLVKPFEKNNLYASINLALENFSNSQPTKVNPAGQILDRVFLKDGQNYTKVFISEILFIEASRSYCKVVTAQQSYTYSFNLKSAMEKLVHPDLIRVHRSFLVNIRNIDKIEGNLLVLGSYTIQMSSSSREDLLNRLTLIR